MRELQSVQLQEFNIKFSVGGSGAPLIFLHNGGSSHRIWDSQMRHFEKQYRVFALDLPGYGLSDKPNKPYPHELYVRVLEEFIEHFNLKQVNLVGHCLGSSIALKYALGKNAKVSSLVLFNTLTDKTLKAGHLGPLVKLGQLMPALFKATAWCSQFFSVPRWLRKQSMADQLQNPADVDPELLLHLQDLYGDRRQLRSLNQILVHLSSFGFTDGLRNRFPTRSILKLNTRNQLPPLMMIWSEKNKILPISAGRKLAEDLEPARFEVIPDTGHLCMCEKPDAVNALLEDFLHKEALNTADSSQTAQLRA